MRTERVKRDGLKGDSTDSVAAGIVENLDPASVDEAISAWLIDNTFSYRRSTITGTRLNFQLEKQKLSILTYDTPTSLFVNQYVEQIMFHGRRIVPCAACSFADRWSDVFGPRPCAMEIEQAGDQCRGMVQLVLLVLSYASHEPIEPL